VWSRTYDGPESGFDTATDIAAGLDGSVYVTGDVGSAGAFATVKFNAGGDFLWDQIEPGDIGSVFPPCQVAVGPDGDVIVAGSPESTCGVFQFKVWKCDAATGAVLWSDKQPGQPCSSFIFPDMTLDKDSPAGTRLWTRTFDGPGTSEDIAAAIATDRWGGVYAAGYTTFPPQNRDYAAVKFSPDGVPAWSVTWASDTGTNDIGHDIAVDPAGDVVLTGNSYDPVHNENAVTIKYHQSPPAYVVELEGGAAARPALTVSPNPVAREAVLRYHLARDGQVRLQVFAPDGRIVRTLVDEAGSAGSHEIRWNAEDASGARLAAGTYLLRLDAQPAGAAAKLSLLP
jgi:hypothetical protein